MTQKITARIIKPTGVERELSADMVVMPGSEGELGVMYNHVPMVVQLKSGDVKIHDGGNVKTMQIEEGVAMINNTSVDIICAS